MTATYNGPPTTDKDWVRFYIGDKEDPFSLTDEEIQALLDDPEYPNRFLASAAALEAINGMGTGVVSKSVAELSVTYGVIGGFDLESTRQRLLERGAAYELKRSGSHVFRTL